MGSRQPMSWLVFDYIPDQPTLLGGPQVVFGRASYDRESDTLTVSTLEHGSESTHGGGTDLLALARLLLVGLHRKQRAAR